MLENMNINNVKLRKQELQMPLYIYIFFF